jgi:hypothetical protein
VTPHDVATLRRTLTVIRNRPLAGQDRQTILKVTAQIDQMVSLLAMYSDEPAIRLRVDLENLWR